MRWSLWILLVLYVVGSLAGVAFIAWDSGLPSAACSGAAFGLVGVILVLAMLAGRSLRRRAEEGLGRTVAGLDVAPVRVSNVPYAVGRHRDRPLSFRYAMVGRGDVVGLVPGGRAPAILGRVKVPGSALAPLHLAVFADTGASAALRRSYGWSEPAPGFWLTTPRGQARSDVEARFHRISPGTREALRAFAARAGPLGIAPDVEVVLVGRTAALRLVGGDAEALACLDLQFRLPLDAPADRVRALCDEAVEVADRVGRELGGAS